MSTYGEQGVGVGEGGGGDVKIDDEVEQKTGSYLVNVEMTRIQGEVRNG